MFYQDKLMDTAFGQTLVEPNMVVINVEKFASTPSGRKQLYFCLCFINYPISPPGKKKITIVSEILLQMYN